MSINPATLQSGSASPALGQAMARLADYADESGVQYPRIAPMTLAAVVAVHVALAVALMHYRTETPVPVQKPIIVNLVEAEPAPEPPKPEVKPPEVIPPVPKPVKKKVQPKPQPKPEPVVQPEPRLVAQAPEHTPAPPAPPVEPVPPAPAPEPTPAPQPPQPEQPPAQPVEPEQPPPVEPPRFNADYLDNPAPGYPPLSRRLGEEGRVMLRVHVAADGKAMTVQLHKSSGFSRLDDVALNTVKRWRFVPARQGDKAVDAWVIVPITFNLKK